MKVSLGQFTLAKFIKIKLVYISFIEKYLVQLRSYWPLIEIKSRLS